MRRLLTILLLMAAFASLVAAFLMRSRVGHPVTARMQSQAEAAIGRPALFLAEIGHKRPTVIVFIKNGCPCSEALEPYTHRLFEAYGHEATFVGVIDSDAEGWTQQHRTPFRILADPERKIVQASGAERSAYVALVTDGGTIERLWPGYSAGMLRELGSWLALILGKAEVPIEVGNAPETPTSGCRFD